MINDIKNITKYLLIAISSMMILIQREKKNTLIWLMNSKKNILGVI